MKCPYCAEIIQSEAIKCRYCGEWLKKDNDNADKSIVEYANQGKETLTNAYHTVFGKSRFPPPSDLEIFQVSKQFSFGETFFIWEGEKYSFSGVRHLSYANSHFSMNLLLHTYDASFEIIHDLIPDGLFVSAAGIMIKGKTTKKIIFAIPYMQKFTFSSRVQYYVDTLKEDGKVKIKDKGKKDVILYANGEISQNGKILSLSTVFDNATYFFGVHSATFGGVQGEHLDPNRIVLAYEDKGLKPGFITSVFSDGPGFALTNKARVDFSPKFDFDVVCSLLKWLGGAKQPK